MCTAGERHAAAAAACCCLFCVTPGFPLPCTVYFELTLGMGLISRTFLPPTGILHLLRVALHFCTVVLCNGLLHSGAGQQASLKVLLGLLFGFHSGFRDLRGQSRHYNPSTG